MSLTEQLSKENSELKLQVQALAEKAKMYDEIEKGIAEFYAEEEDDNDNIDLGTIGEYIASYFGYI